jgi:hypothetical protein
MSFLAFWIAIFKASGFGTAATPKRHQGRGEAGSRMMPRKQKSFQYTTMEGEAMARLHELETFRVYIRRVIRDSWFETDPEVDFANSTEYT